jgi:A/G-specific adenine glycosylase
VSSCPLLRGAYRGDGEAVNRALRAWYEPRRDAYPWRRRPDPYRVLVSEIMLQQTQAARVAPAFRSFLRRFPTVRALAGASRSDVLRAWGTLGYNRRAVALHEAARAIVAHHRGRVPSDEAELVRLPGVGPYTAAAVLSLAFGRSVPAMDTNVARVVGRARLGVDGASPAAVRTAAASWIDRDDPSAWNQALMDLGREVCRPRPRCDECPLASTCRFRRAQRAPGGTRTRQSPFAGSFRQVRGGVVRVLRAQPGATLDSMAREFGEPIERVAAAVAALAADGVVSAGRAALAGRPGGRVRLAE